MDGALNVADFGALPAGGHEERTGERVCPAQRGNDAAPSPIFSASVRDRLVRLAYRFLWNRGDAEDVVQEALVTAHERAGDLRDREQWWSWISRIVVRRCHEYGRRKQRRERHESALPIEAARRSHESRHEDAPETKEIVRRLLRRLPRRQQEVIILRHLQEMSFGEIADILEISPATARVHAQAGRETLRRLLNEEHPGWFE